MYWFQRSTTYVKEKHILMISEPFLFALLRGNLRWPYFCSSNYFSRNSRPPSWNRCSYSHAIILSLYFYFFLLWQRIWGNNFFRGFHGSEYAQHPCIKIIPVSTRLKTQEFLSFFYFILSKFGILRLYFLVSIIL